MFKALHYPLLSHNTFGIEVYSDRFVEFVTEEEIRAFFQDTSQHDDTCFVIGGGSNLLFCKDYPGTILHSALQGMEVVNETNEELHLRVGSGVVWDGLVAYCVQHGWGGMENLSLIPGEVGASAVQNIGAYGAEVSSLIISVEAVDMKTGETRCFSNEDCQYAYRNSIFKGELKGKYFITYVTYRLMKRPQPNLGYAGLQQALAGITSPTLAEVREAVIAIRREKLPDPAELGNAGSFFMNPVVPRSQYEALLCQYPGMPHYSVDEAHVKIPAGWMIEQCGWKGRSEGRAAVHNRQALVLVNTGGATAAEIVHLASCVAASVHEKFGIAIHPEVNYIQ